MSNTNDQNTEQEGNPDGFPEESISDGCISAPEEKTTTDEDEAIEKYGREVLESFEEFEKSEEYRNECKRRSKKERKEKEHYDRTGLEAEYEECSDFAKVFEEDAKLIDDTEPETRPDGAKYRPWKIPAEDIRIIFANIRKKVLGQKEAIDQIEQLFLVNTVRPKTDKGCVFTVFLNGPSGCGKTMIFEEIVKEINILNRSRGLNLRKTTFHKIPLNNYYAIEIPSLVGGVAPGWSGTDKSSLLASIAKQIADADCLMQTAVIVLDEFDKLRATDNANDRTAMDTLSEIFENAIFTLKSGEYEKLDFRNVIWVITGNFYQNTITEKQRKIGFLNDDSAGGKSSTTTFPETDKEVVLSKLKTHFSISSMNRIDKVIIFDPLSESVIDGYIRKEYRIACAMIRRTYPDIGILPEVETYMNKILSGYEVSGGFRAVTRHIHREIVADILEKYLYSEVQEIPSNENGKHLLGDPWKSPAEKPQSIH